MAKVVRFREFGGPEVIRLEDAEVREPGEGQARVRHAAIGVNFIDTYQRSGLYPIPIPGGIGERGGRSCRGGGSRGVTVVKPGDRVAYAGGSPPGSLLRKARLIPAAVLVPIPDGDR